MVGKLEEIAGDIRQDIVYMSHSAQGAPHPGGALSAADIMAALYFGEMRLTDNPEWADRDRFVLSKGHASPVLYAALCRKGYFPRDWYDGLRGLGCKLQGHPDMRKTPGVDMTAGSLGNGLALAAGMALGIKLDGGEARVYVMLGDGELQEGLVWESALYSANIGLDNLIAIVDNNGYQSCGQTAEISSVEPIEDKFLAFGWNAQRIDGHDVKSILAALERARTRDGKPSVIIADTVKGKGVSFMENNNAWHQKKMGDEQFDVAMKELTNGGRQ